MSGPQGTDPSQPWQGQEPAWGQPASGAEQPTTAVPAWGQPAGTEQPTTAAPAWGQQPAYNPEQYQQQYPAVPQPGAAQPGAQQAPGYPQQPYGQPGYPQQGAYGQQPYGQPQYGQPQYGQPQYGQQQFGQAPAGQQFDQQFGAPGAKKSNKALLVIGGVVAAVIVAVVAVLGFVWPGWFVTTKLDINAAQTGVQKILTDETNGYGAKNVKDVKCNGGTDPEVKSGQTFNCDVSIDGTKRTVTVTFKDDSGTYEVGRPK